MRSAVLIATLAILLSGCVTPKITKRYETKQLTTATNPAYGPSLTVFATDVPVATPQTTFASLSDRGQAALIRELSAKATDAHDLIRLLGTPIPGPNVQHRTMDLTVFERRLVFSVENRSPNPGDRLDRVAMILTPSSPGEFVSWNQFVTKYQTTNLGTIEFTQNRQAGIELNAGAPTGGVKGSASAVENLKETLNLSHRFVDVTGTLTPTEARIVEDGAFGIDLTGNTIVDFTVRVVNRPGLKELDTLYTFSFPKLFEDKEVPLSANVIKFERQTVKFVLPTSCQEITASSQLLSTLRRIDRNEATIMEGDDKARYESITSTPRTFTLVPKELLRASVWLLTNKEGWPVNLSGPVPQKNEVLLFGTYDEAVVFLRYLSKTKTPNQVGDRMLLLNNQPLTGDLVDTLQVEIQKLNWDMGSPCA